MLTEFLGNEQIDFKVLKTFRSSQLNFKPQKSLFLYG